LNFGSIGVNVGAHRLWSHRSFKAHFILRTFLMICNTIAAQNSIIWWARDHRVHHKYTDTDADPYNANRGIFFSHMGWLLVKKHPDVIEAGRKIDYSDLLADPILRFQRKNFIVLLLLLSVFLPISTSIYFWQETWTIGTLCIFFRFILILTSVSVINSLAHRYGNKPYDKNISPSQNFVAEMITLGEGWHNYHHVRMRLSRESCVRNF
jgi:stearoyl-CoA desaturase (Delta-9 desaturase)